MKRVSFWQQILTKRIVLVRPTSFIPTRPANENARLKFHELYEEIVQDEVRNQLICSEVISAVQRGRSPIILTERNDHLDRLFEKLSPHIQHLIVLRGGMIFLQEMSRFEGRTRRNLEHI